MRKKLQLFKVMNIVTNKISSNKTSAFSRIKETCLFKVSQERSQNSEEMNLVEKNY